MSRLILSQLGNSTRVAVLSGIVVLCGVGVSSTASAADGTLTTLPIPVPPVVATSVLTGSPDPNQLIHVSVSIPPQNAVSMQNYADAVSNPRSPYYQQFLTPVQFGQKFGISTNRVNQLAAYLTGQGFTIKLVADSHLAILADCTISQAEAAFHTRINTYHSNQTVPYGRSEYYSFERPLQVPSSIANMVLSVSGLEDYYRPVPRLKKLGHSAPLALLKGQGGVQTLTPTQTRTLYNTAPIYNAGMTGTGRNVAISSFDGFSLSNVPLYYTQYSLVVPAGGVGSNITVVTIDGGSQSNSPGGEADLDIQMVLGMAPTCTFTVYDGASVLNDVLTREAQDNTADIISESYGWVLSAQESTACHNTHVQMTTQGITYMEATGDNGTTLEPAAYSNYEPEVFQVGGTTATVASDGTRMTEVGWSGSGGGWATDAVPFNVLPSWQKGTNVPTTINFRLNPDLALHAAGDNGAYLFYLGGTLTTGFDGTSFASPVFAGSLGTSEQKMISLGDLTVNGAGKRRLGRISDLIYQQNGRSDVYFDILSGNNGTLPNGQQSNAGPFWDFVTGFGSINFNAFVATFNIISHPILTNPSAVSVYSNQGRSPSGGVSQLSAKDGQYYTLSSVPSSQGGLAAAQISFNLSTPVSQLATLSVNMVERGPSGTTNFVYVYNFNTKLYDLMKTSPNSGLDLNFAVPITNIADHVSSTGQVLVIDRMVWPRRNGQPYTMKLDLAQLTATRTG